ncbi:hypothetical protein [Desulfobulbus oligotrophicus]|uniref:Uncharacterized protein n=1 Tax=Desulfobulbus oligotrophicus TaxID=1909699 RepID=A0A7T5VDJ8_9BACT|nr:hypothetical protein [Desulfobulbus oligotrophicus]QQG65922.1 hypothetical protein HP555_08600 [Desulfobulbus oligotrophicus]
MKLLVKQDCPQCGAPVELTEAESVLYCGSCGIRSMVQSNSPPRYVLPMAGDASSAGLLLAPYVRFKGTIYLVTESGIDHRVIDTTRVASSALGLPPSLGVRPQAMRLQRIDPAAENLFLTQTLKASAILEKAAAVGNLVPQIGQQFLHRAYIGEHLSYIYLPLVIKHCGLHDGVTGDRLCDLVDFISGDLANRRYDDGWQVRFVATLCPQCGAGLEGSSDCQVMTCPNCHSAWGVTPKQLVRLDWQMQAGDSATKLFLPFWKISTHIPVLNIYSFADFVERTNQPFLPRPQWRSRVMSVWVPAIRLRPKVFLLAGRQATLGQWRLRPVTAKLQPNFFPATLPFSEARQAVKLMLAASTASPRRIFPMLPYTRLTEMTAQLIYLPFTELGCDWVQPHTGVTIGKNILKFGRTL